MDALSVTVVIIACLLGRRGAWGDLLGMRSSQAPTGCALRLVRGAKIVHVALDNGLDLIHAGSGWLFGIKARGVLFHVAHEAVREGLAQLGGIVHLTYAVGDGLSHLVVGYAGGAVEHQGYAQARADGLENAQ